MGCELFHYGVKGMKWGVRRKGYSDDGGVTGAIRRKQMSNAQRDLGDIQKRKKQVVSELRELRGYEKNATGLAASKVSTAIRRNQIKSLEKTKSKLDTREKDNRDAIKELETIHKNKARMKADKAAEKIKTKKIQDLQKEYGNLEDSLTYGKNKDIEKNKKIEKEMDRLEEKMRKLKGR